jgi:rSAM/selenodomain-associated transferase 1
MPDPALVIIARAPQLGQVKTRLAAGIGPSAALEVYRALLAVVVTVQAAWRGPVLLAADGPGQAWTGTGLEHLPRHPQPAGGLGGRIAAALHQGVAEAGRAIAIGTDCPGLRATHLSALAGLLDHVPVAFGPAVDGGYWGVAVAGSQALPLLCADDLPWSSGTLLAETRRRLDQAGLPHAAADTLADCDDAADLAAAVHSGFLAWPPAGVPRP